MQPSKVISITGNPSEKPYGMLADQYSVGDVAGIMCVVGPLITTFVPIYTVQGRKMFPSMKKCAFFFLVWHFCFALISRLGLKVKGVSFQNFLNI